MAIIRNTYTDALFNGLMAAGCTIYGACGAMGNIYAESGANPRNLENLCEKRLNYKYTDDTYTTAVDSGEISRDLFLHPLGDSRQYGYGFCQWTSAGRKAGLYDLVKSKGVSIGDPDTQVEFMLKELQQSYKSVLQVLKTATSVQEASDIFLVKFEVPANTGSEVKKTRASYGEQYLKIYKDIEKEETNMSLISNSGHDENGKYSGGKAGDQTGTEWALIPWYNRPWKCVLRHIKLTDNWWHVSLEYKEEAEMQEITMSKMERLEAEKEDFKQMYAECFPHLAIVADILKKFGDEREIQTDGAHIYITPNGYISMSNVSEGWSLSRLNHESKPEIRCEVIEEIEEE